jgi:tRNA 5-methylaminomethyl-2-thiouridine biosynthesis bifunctional protein
MAPPLHPAAIDWGPDGLPRSASFGDVYHPAHGAFEQAEAVFLAGNGLPGRWRGRERFVVLETGFGLGSNFLATWQAWRDDPQRCARLWFVSIEAHPARREDLQRTHSGGPAAALGEALRDAWPPAVAGLHTLAFEAGRVVLLLAFGDIADLLPQLRLAADAIYLDGFAPARNPAMWSADVFARVARLAAPGATAATWSVARGVREGLEAAGFEIQRLPGPGDKREICVARFAPRFHPRPPPAEAAPDPAPRSVAVVGAGIAGACLARELCRNGAETFLLDAAPAPAAGASGNPGGLIHGVVHPDDGPHARWLRAGAMQAARNLAPLLAEGRVAGRLDGLLRLADETADGAAGLLQRHGLPPELVRWQAASDCAAGWWWPTGGVVDAAGWVQGQLDEAVAAGLQWRPGCGVDSLRTRRTAPSGTATGGWQLLDTAGHLLCEADDVVLANADGALRLAVGAGAAVEHWTLLRSRGQVSWLTEASAPPWPVASQSYATPLPGATGLLIGATSDDDPTGTDPQPRADDHRRNLERLARLLPDLAASLRLAGLDDPARWQGRVGWRLRTGDRLPLAGPLAAEPAGSACPTQLGRVARVPGLHILAALGSRGLSLAPLAARLVTARLLGLPWPVDRTLAEAVDPARFAVRAARKRSPDTVTLPRAPAAR